MKCNNTLWILIALYLSIPALSVQGSESMSTETEFEADLVSLLSKFHNKQQQNLKKDKDLVKVKIQNVIDLQDNMVEAEKQKLNFQTERESYKKDLDSSTEKLTNQIKDNQNNLSSLKDNFDKIIETSNQVHKDMIEKKTEQIQLKTIYENIKPEYEIYNERFYNKLIATKKSLDKQTNSFQDFNKKLSEVNLLLNKRSKLQGSLLKAKEINEKNELEMKKMKSSSNESKLEAKLFKAIESNLQSNNNEVEKSTEKSSKYILSLRKLSKDKENHKKLEIEKSQQNELFKDTTNKIKGLLHAHEKLQYEIQGLIKTKNKLKQQLSSKDIENSLKLDKLKNEIFDLQRSVKDNQSKILGNIKSHKTVKLI